MGKKEEEEEEEENEEERELKFNWTFVVWTNIDLHKKNWKYAQRFKNSGPGQNCKSS